jgi:hypothetical protein
MDHLVLYCVLSSYAGLAAGVFLLGLLRLAKAADKQSLGQS